MSGWVELTLDVSSVPEKPAGAGRYIVELARQLSLRTDARTTLITRRDDVERWERLSGTRRISAVAPTSRPLRLLWEQRRLPAVLRSIAPLVHHGPHYTIPERARVPTISTIHDMTFFDHPEWHERSKVAFFRRAIKRAVRRASGLIAVSNDTANRLQDRFGKLDVSVIPHGVEHARFFPGGSGNDAELLAAAGISGEYIAFVGTLEPRKDVPTLIEAFDKIAGRFPDLRLVLAGSDGWGMSAITKAIDHVDDPDRIVRTGFLPDLAVPALLRSARVIAYPSLTEGFGLPALEALACGAALVTTRGSAMEEVVEDAAQLVSPGNADELAQALEAMLEDESGTNVLRRRGPQVAAKYTWEASAEAHMEVYRKVVAAAP